ncbi:MAG: tetratricopeptide repeat protein [Planctomycetota bacterium]|nr:tetratricopeptide repeat protein [Planctomycetota bacterium]
MAETDEKTRERWWMLPVAVLATLAVYLLGGALDGELVYDDLQMIARNPLITDLANVPTIFTQAYWDFLGPETASFTGYWRPLTATALTLAHELGDGSTRVFHAFSILIHLCATTAVYFLALRVSGDARVGFFSALLFGLHPVQVESVAWITALNDPLFGLFTLLSLLAFLRWRDCGSRGWPILPALLFVPALLSKELAVAVVPLAAAIDVGRRRVDGDLRSGLTAPVRAYAPFAVVLLLYYCARVAVFESPWAGLDRITTWYGVGLGRLLLLRLELVGGAIGLLALPLDLNLFRPFKPELGLGDPTLLRAVLWTLLAAGALVWMLRRRVRPALLALLVVPAALMPILIRVESLGRFPLSERFLYLPVLGFVLLASLSLFRWLPGRAATAVLLFVGLGYGYGTWQRIGVWSDEETLFRAAAADNPESVYVKWGLGRVLLGRYQETGDRTYLSEAFEAFTTGQDILSEVRRDFDGAEDLVTSTDFLQTNLGYGWCLLFEADFDEFHDYGTPIAIFERLAGDILEIRQGAEQARRLGIPVIGEHLELELVLTALGVAHTKAGDLTAAESSLRAALAENPRYAEAYRNLGWLFAQREDWSSARKSFEQALKLRPDHYPDRVALAQALFQDGWPERAADLARELHAERPAETEPLLVLASVDSLRRRWTDALGWLERVIAVAPRTGIAWRKKAAVLIELGQHDEAIPAFRRAVELMPNDFEAHYNFAAYLDQSGATETALPYFARAYRLCRDRGLLIQLREALIQYPFESAELPLELGTIDRIRGLNDSALAWLDVALATEPENAEALLQKGRVHRARGDARAAFPLMEAAARHAPEAFAPRYELAQVQIELGLRDDALASLRRAREIGLPASWNPDLRTSTERRIDSLIAKLESGQPVEGLAPETGPEIGPPSAPPDD